MLTLATLLWLSFVPTAAPKALPSAGSGAPGREPLRVFLVLGQSNAEGADAHAAEIDSFPPFIGAGAPQQDARLWYWLGGVNGPNSGGFVPMQPSGPNGMFGPEVTFARAVTRRTGAGVAVIKCAKGGTNLAVDWDPDATDGERMYARALRLAREGLARLEADGEDFVLEAVLWHQGENDMLNNEHVQQYGPRLAELVARLNADLEAPDLPWFVGGTSFKCIWGLDYADNMAVLLEQQLAVTEADPRVTFVPTSHLAFDVFPGGQPHYHFGTEGQLQLGERYARAYLDSIGYDTSHRPASFPGGVVPVQAGDTVRVFVLVGQRSMEGEGAHVQEIAGVPGFEDLDAMQDEVLYRYHLGGGEHVAAEWAPLGPCGYLGSFGPELSFGREVARLHEDPVAVLRIADSAAFLVDWIPGHPKSNRPLSADAVRFVRAALDDLRARGATASLEGLFWLPAEHDAWWTPYRNQVQNRLPQVLAALRAELEAPELPVFLIELRDDLVWGAANLDDLDARLGSVASADPRTWFVRTGDLTPASPAPTLGTRGALELGRLMARAHARTLR
jgi:hypothetical protein